LAVAAVFALLKLMPMMSHSFTQFCSGGVTRFWVLVYCLLSVDYVQVEGRIVRKFSRCVHVRVCNRVYKRFFQMDFGNSWLQVVIPT